MLFFVNVGFSVGTEAVNAFFPLYLQNLGASILEVGFFLSISGVVATVVMLVSGWMSDRFGRKKIMILGLVLTFFPPLLYTLVVDWRILVPLGAIYAASFSIFMPARIAYVADSVSSKVLAKVYGYMNLAFPIGSLIGPMMAGLLADIGGFHYPFYFAATVSIFSFIPALLIFEEKPRRYSRDIATTHTRDKGGLTGETFGLLVILTAYNLIVSAGIGATYSFLPIYLSEVFLVDKLYIGIFFSLVGVSLFGSQIIGGWACSRFGMKKMMLSCLSLITPLFVVCAFAPSYELFTITYMVLYGFFGMTWPASISMFMDIVESSKRGFATGIRQMGIRLGFTIGPTVGSLFWLSYGPSSSFYASAIFIGLSIMFLSRIKEP